MGLAVTCQGEHECRDGEQGRLLRFYMAVLQQSGTACVCKLPNTGCQCISPNTHNLPSPSAPFRGSPPHKDNEQATKAAEHGEQRGDGVDAVDPSDLARGGGAANHLNTRHNSQSKCGARRNARLSSRRGTGDSTEHRRSRPGRAPDRIRSSARAVHVPHRLPAPPPRLLAARGRPRPPPQPAPLSAAAALRPAQRDLTVAGPDVLSPTQRGHGPGLGRREASRSPPDTAALLPPAPRPFPPPLPTCSPSTPHRGRWGCSARTAPQPVLRLPGALYCHRSTA